MTAITDYLITVLSTVLGVRLIQKGVSSDQLSIILWGIGFIVTGIGAFAGGTSHGFLSYFNDKQNKIIWKIATYSIGLSSLLILLGSIISSVDPSITQYSLYFIAFLIFIIYSLWLINHDEFIYVILDYVPSMIIIIILKLYSYYGWNDPSSIYLIMGIIIAFLGAGIQFSKISLHKHMNHNDIFHFVQMLSLIFLYIGALKLQDLPI